jgi:hypothetical protein
MIGLLALFLFGCGYVYCKKRPERLLREAVSKGLTFDAIIVPGVPFNGNSWSRVMKGRVLWSYILYKNGLAKNIIYSGGAVYSPYYEAKIMGLYAMQLGIPANHIFYDTLAEHSTENVYYSYELARKQGFRTIALATDPFQSFMLISFTNKHFRSPIMHLPFVTDSLKQYEYLEPAINPSSAKNTSNFNALPNRKSLWKRLHGTLGKDIHWDRYPDGKVPQL